MSSENNYIVTRLIEAEALNRELRQEKERLENRCMWLERDNRDLTQKIRGLKNEN